MTRSSIGEGRRNNGGAGDRPGTGGALEFRGPAFLPADTHFARTSVSMSLTGSDSAGTRFTEIGGRSAWRWVEPLVHQVNVLAQPVRGAFDFAHHCAVQEAVEQTGGERVVTEDLVPVTEAAVGGEDQGARKSPWPRASVDHATLSPGPVAPSPRPAGSTFSPALFMIEVNCGIFFDGHFSTGVNPFPWTRLGSRYLLSAWRQSLDHSRPVPDRA